MKPSKTTQPYSPWSDAVPTNSLSQGGRSGTVRTPMLVRSVVAFVIFMGFATTGLAKDRWEILEAIHMVENPTNSTRVGSHGELGPYQFRPSTWRMHTKRPFHLAVDRTESDKVAVSHYEWIKKGLEEKGLEATPYRIALAWNAGLSAAVRGDVGIASISYARRVDNLVEDMKRQQLASKM